VNEPEKERYTQIVAKMREEEQLRQAGYREKALKLFPHVCARCVREFEGKKLRELTVHHRDHNHDNNPPDGSNWENLCLYCHDNEHSRYIDHVEGSDDTTPEEDPGALTHSPFAALADLLKKKPQ
jgi:5-methylcytosine-specific restriction endonuclease McrA